MDWAALATAQPDMKTPKLLNLSLTSQNLIQELALLDKKLKPYADAAVSAKLLNSELSPEVCDASRPVLQEHMNAKNQLILSLWNDLCVQMQTIIKEEQ